MLVSRRRLEALEDAAGVALNLNPAEIRKLSAAELEERSAGADTLLAVVARQSRLFALGGLLRHFIHECRQTLNALSLITTSVELALDHDFLDRGRIKKLQTSAFEEIAVFDAILDGYNQYFRGRPETGGVPVAQAFEALALLFSPATRRMALTLRSEVEDGLELACEFAPLVSSMSLIVAMALDDRGVSGGPAAGITLKTERGAAGSLAILIVHESHSIPARPLEPRADDQGTKTADLLLTARFIVERQLGAELSIASGVTQVEYRILLPALGVT